MNIPPSPKEIFTVFLFDWVTAGFGISVESRWKVTLLFTFFCEIDVSSVLSSLILGDICWLIIGGWPWCSKGSGKSAKGKSVPSSCIPPVLTIGCSSAGSWFSWASVSKSLTPKGYLEVQENWEVLSVLVVVLVEQPLGADEQLVEEVQLVVVLVPVKLLLALLSDSSVELWQVDFLPAQFVLEHHW